MANRLPQPGTTPQDCDHPPPGGTPSLRVLASRHSFEGGLAVSDQTVRCERCEKTYPADEPSCPNCRRIRQSNIVIGTTMVLLIILVVVGWFGMQVLFM